MSKKKYIRHHYRPRIDADRPSYEVLDWASAASQEARFRVLAENVDLGGRSLLDVGCGLGDLWAYLQQRGIDADYTGVDLLEEMVTAARQRHPGGRFQAGDIFAASPFEPETFDVVYCSGAFNLNLGNNLQFLPLAVAAMCRLARHHVVFNLLHVRARSEEHRYFYFDPEHVRAMLTGPTCRVRIIDNYLPNDFTVICQKSSPCKPCTE